jgi:hypothetical protein
MGKTTSSKDAFAKHSVSGSSAGPSEGCSEQETTIAEKGTTSALEHLIRSQRPA